MIRRIRNLWNLSRFRPELEETENPLEPLGLPIKRIVLAEDTGEVDGEFFGAGTEEEFRKHERKEKGLFNIFGLDSEEK